MRNHLLCLIEANVLHSGKQSRLTVGMISWILLRQDCLSLLSCDRQRNAPNFP